MSVKILVVEDEAPVAEGIQRTLLDLGYEVPETVDSGEEAIRAAYEHSPALVLMDVRISGELDGIQTATVLQNLLHVPIIYLTCFSDDATLHRAKATTPYGYLLKPFDVRELHSSIEVAIYKHGIELRRAVRELSYSTMLDSIGEGVISADRAGVITFINAAGEKVTGWPRKEALGRALHEVLCFSPRDVEPPTPTTPWSRLGQGAPCSPNLLSRSGKWVVIDERSVPIRDDSGEVLGGIIIFHDSTALLPKERSPISLGEPPCSRRPPDAAPPRRGRVLVVDAELQVAQAMARILGREHEVFIETDAGSALSRLSDGEEFDVVFCDLMMPGISGMDLYAALAGTRPEVAERVVFLTTDDVAQDSKRFLESIANVSISKPFATESLRALVKNHIR